MRAFLCICPRTPELFLTTAFVDLSNPCTQPPKCTQLPAVVKPAGVTLVISPLISLIMDQVSQLEAANVNANYFDSSNPDRANDIFRVCIPVFQRNRIHVVVYVKERKLVCICGTCLRFIINSWRTLFSSEMWSRPPRRHFAIISKQKALFCTLRNEKGKVAASQGFSPERVLCATQDLDSPCPSVRLLYVTPEKVAK